MKKGAKQVDVEVKGKHLLRLIVTDGKNGTSYDWADWGQPTFHGPQGEVKLTSLKYKSGTTGHGNIEKDRNVVKKPMRIDDKTIPWGLGVHAPSEIVYAIPKGTTRFTATVGPDTGSVEQKNTKVAIRFLVMASDDAPAPSAGGGPAVRVSLTNDDPLTRALGRPNREQVVTQRESVATTLQALELTNGETLDSRLKTGAKHWMSAHKSQSDAIIEGLFAQALGRSPSAKEKSTAKAVVGSPATAEGVADLLWIVTLLPEFQLIR